MTAESRRRLGEAIKARRLALGLSVAAAAKLAHVDRGGTWSPAEAGAREIEAFTAAKIERALAWAPGSIDAVLDGGEPTELPTTPAPTPPRASEAEPTLEQEIERLRHRAGLTPAQRRAALRALIDFYAEDIDERAEERPTA